MVGTGVSSAFLEVQAQGWNLGPEPSGRDPAQTLPREGEHRGPTVSP